MILEFDDWRFDVDISATAEHTGNNALDHCVCAYCKNYYDTVAQGYPQVIGFLQSFGIDHHGPSELMPFMPTLLLACYRVQGRILQWSDLPLMVENIPITVEAADDSSFFLWAGEFFLPWVQEELPEDVVFPANLPEFLERMEEVWILRHGEDNLMS